MSGVWEVSICFLNDNDEEKVDTVQVANNYEAIRRIKAFREYCNQEGLIILGATIDYAEDFDSYDIDLL